MRTATARGRQSRLSTFAQHVSRPAYLSCAALPVAGVMWCPAQHRLAVSEPCGRLLLLHWGGAYVLRPSCVKRNRASSHPTQAVRCPGRPIGATARDPVRDPGRIQPRVGDTVRVDPRVRVEVDLPRAEVSPVARGEVPSTLEIRYAPGAPPPPAEDPLRDSTPGCCCRQRVRAGTGAVVVLRVNRYDEGEQPR
jgi:hypothetical protein